MRHTSPPVGLGTVICGGPVPVPVTTRETVPPLEVKLTFPVTLTGAVGVKRTTTVWLVPAPRLKDPPGGEKMPNEVEAEAFPVRVPPPMFWTVKLRSAELPRVTLPKSCEAGVTLIAGGGTTRVHRSAVPSFTLGKLMLDWLPEFDATWTPTVADPPRSADAHAPPKAVS